MSRLSLSQEVYNRLRATLPSDVPVLLPGEFMEPAEYIAAPPEDGQPLPASTEGLGAYLRDQAPHGYVQLYRESIGTSSGALERPTLQVDVYAPDHAQATALMDAVSRTLLSRPTRPTPFATAFTSQVLSENAQHCRLSLTFEVRKLGASYDSTQ